MATLKAIPGGQAATGVEPYGFTVEFERALIYLCCVNRDLFSRIGTRLDSKALSDKNAIQLLKAAQAIAADIGEGPSHTLSVVQRLRSWRESGKVTIEQVKDAMEYLDAAEDAGLPDAEEVIKEVAELIKKRTHRENAKKVMDTLAKGGDFTKLGAEMAAAERIGESRSTAGEAMHDELLDAILADNARVRFPTGCIELDSIIGGGLPIGYTLFLGREKSGKSMVLSSIAAEALLRGQNVAIATLELEPRKQYERIFANMLGLPIHVIQTDGRVSKERFAAIKPYLGQVRCARFSSDTPVADILAWADKVEQMLGKIDLLVVDYADLVGSGKSGRESDSYRDARVVGNALREHALKRGYVAISATQGKRGSGVNKPLDIDDVADSQHKVRIADLVVAMRMDQDQKDMIDWFVILNRDGTDRVGTTPIPACREMGRMFPVNREEPW